MVRFRTCNSDQKWNNEICRCECKNYCTCKKDYNWNPSKCICQNDKYLKRIPNTSVIACDEIISAMDILSTKTTSTIAAIVSRNSDGKKVRYQIYCYIFYVVSLMIRLLLIITTICYHYKKHGAIRRD